MKEISAHFRCLLEQPACGAGCGVHGSASAPCRLARSCGPARVHRAEFGPRRSISGGMATSSADTKRRRDRFIGEGTAIAELPERERRKTARRLGDPARAGHGAAAHAEGDGDPGCVFVPGARGVETLSELTQRGCGAVMTIRCVRRCAGGARRLLALPRGASRRRRRALAISRRFAATRAAPAPHAPGTSESRCIPR